MSRIDMIIDFETFGTTASCAVIDMSSLVFDWDRFESEPYTYVELLSMTKRYKFSVADQVKNYHYEVEPDSVAFWKRQSHEVRQRILPADDDLPLKNFVDNFIKDLYNGPKIEYWWSRNNTFDPVILFRLMHTQNKWLTLDQYLRHWRVRDVKTWIDAKFDFTTESGFVPLADIPYWDATFKQHDSSHDVVADVLRLQAIYRAERDLEQTKR